MTDTFHLDPFLYGRCKQANCACGSNASPSCPHFESIPGKMTIREFRDWANAPRPIEDRTND